MDPRSIGFFTGNSDYVTSLHANCPKDFLLSVQGNRGSGRVVEYSLSTGKVRRDFGSIFDNEIYVCDVFEDIYFFGGYTDKIGLIDKKSGQMHLDVMETAIGYMYSMDVCRLGGKSGRVLLVVTGYYRDYSGCKTDVFDITKILQLQN